MSVEQFLKPWAGANGEIYDSLISGEMEVAKGANPERLAVAANYVDEAMVALLNAHLIAAGVYMTTPGQRSDNPKVRQLKDDVADLGNLVRMAAKIRGRL